MMAVVPSALPRRSSAYWRKYQQQDTRFAELLIGYCAGRGWSLRRLAQAIGMEVSYLNRISHGLRPPPERKIVERMVQSLELSGVETRQLLTVAGHAPVTEWTAALEATYLGERPKEGQ